MYVFSYLGPGLYSELFSLFDPIFLVALEKIEPKPFFKLVGILKKK